MGIAAVLKELRKNRRLTVDELCAQLGVKRGTYIHYEVGDREPGLNLLVRLADFYSVSIDMMLDRQGDTEDVQLVHCYNQASTDDKYVVWAVLNKYRKTKKNTGQPKREMPHREMPLYHLPASAGTGMFLDSIDFDMVRVGPDVPIASNLGVRISGDSMEPNYPDGSIAWVHIVPEIRDGEIGVFVLNGEGYIKKYQKGSLVSLNPEYEPIVLREGDSLRTVGKVLHVTKNF